LLFSPLSLFLQNGKTPLDWARGRGHRGCVELLESHLHPQRQVRRPIDPQPASLLPPSSACCDRSHPDHRERGPSSWSDFGEKRKIGRWSPRSQLSSSKKKIKSWAWWLKKFVPPLVPFPCSVPPPLLLWLRREQPKPSSHSELKSRPCSNSSPLKRKSFAARSLASLWTCRPLRGRSQPLWWQRSVACCCLSSCHSLTLSVSLCVSVSLERAGRRLEGLLESLEREGRSILFLFGGEALRSTDLN
jgi:hypothetical protein